MQTEEDRLATLQPDVAQHAAAAGQTSDEATSGAPQMWSHSAVSSPAYGTPRTPIAGCGRCGLPAAFGASFCAGCGAPLAAPLTPPSPAQPTSPQQTAYGVPPMVPTAAYPYAAAPGQSSYAGYASGNVPPATWPPVPTLTIQMAGVPGGLLAARYAGFGLRLVAWVVDAVCIVVLLVAALFWYGVVLGVTGSAGQVTPPSSSPASETGAPSSSVGSLLIYLFFLVVPWLYYTIAESSQYQATPGKRLIGLRVVSDAGTRISFGRANGRYWAKALSRLTFGIGYLVCAFTERKQALHDLMSGCYVVSVRR
jgi:uncharacterized RDD family membrane protein YckC